MNVAAQNSIDEARFKLNQDIKEAEQRREAQVALIASLAGQGGERAEALQALDLIETTLRQAQQNHALVKSLSEGE
ncbi:hypothetical protein [Methylobacterium sp. E-045]|uniref:hypothetical protein n=1 Tax=Methylobacterium sp. E-045 TaxID=2836575 RepID=UPI001FB95F6E|nr:hypothetical protein [Methylobacterium sp. E-045]MCJ2127294.1 hypothetical protein [Methylobacterium sp. E-045]